MNCLALVYKKCSTDKVMMSLAAIQDMSHLKKVYIECLTLIIITFIIVNRGGLYPVIIWCSGIKFPFSIYRR